MGKRQPPVVRAGSGDSHEARLAVLEQRFSEGMQARCSWCNQIGGAKQGEWLEVIISTPGTGIRPAHVFRCFGCEGSTATVSGGIVAVPSGSRRPGDSPPPLPARLQARAAAQKKSPAAARNTKGASRKTRAAKGDRKDASPVHTQPAASAKQGARRPPHPRPLPAN